MKSIFEINIPCPENWEGMPEDSGGRFCDVCEKKVWDFDTLSENEAEILVQKQPICGKITKSNLAIAGIILSISFTGLSCSSQKNEYYKTEAKADKIIKISGKISWAPNIKLKPKEIKLLTKKKLYRGRIDDQNNFEIEIPESALKDKNIIKINFSKIYSQNWEDDFTLQVVSKSDLLSEKTIIADDDTVEIGAVVIVLPEPPDFYFLDGKSIAKRKFDLIKKENPNFEVVALDDDVIKKTITKEYSGTVYLMYSKLNTSEP